LFDCIYLLIALYIAVYVSVMTILCYLVLWPQEWINTTTTTTMLDHHSVDWVTSALAWYLISHLH